MEWTPVPIATFLLLHLGEFAGPAALLGGLAVVMVLGGAAGAVWAAGSQSRRHVFGPVLAAALLFVALLPLTADLSILVAFMAAYVPTLTLLTARRGETPGRREFLIRSGWVLGGVAGLLGLYAVEPLLSIAGGNPLFPYRRPRGLDVPGLQDLVTPPSRFYVMDKVLQYPRIDVGVWRLIVDGAVRRPLALDFDGLRQHASRHEYITMECVDNPVGGPLMGNALWTGVSVSDVLREAGAMGDFVVFHSADDYSEGATRALLEEAGALIAYGMNGDLLPRAHGFPARLVLPGVYGFKSVKWLTRIHVLQGAQSGDWSVHGWSDTPAIRTTTRIDVARRVGNQVLLAGVAFAGTRRIRAVEVRVNGGPWRRAALGPALSRSAWVQWSVRLSSPSPAHVEARAIDGLGHVQTGRQHGAYPSGATGWASTVL